MADREKDSSRDEGLISSGSFFKMAVHNTEDFTDKKEETLILDKTIELDVLTANSMNAPRKLSEAQDSLIKSVDDALQGTILNELEYKEPFSITLRDFAGLRPDYRGDRNDKSGKQT